MLYHSFVFHCKFIQISGTESILIHLFNENGTQIRLHENKNNLNENGEFPAVIMDTGQH